MKKMTNKKSLADGILKLKKITQRSDINKKNYRLIPFFLSLFFLIVTFSVYVYSQPAAASTQTEELSRLDRLLASLSNFDHSQGEALSLELNELVFRFKDNAQMRPVIEKKLLEFFEKPVTLHARVAVSKPLSFVGGTESAEVLGRYLTDPEVSDPARYVLERIPGEEVDRAFLEALNNASPAVVPGIISSLGHRRARASVPYFEKLLQTRPLPEIRTAILEALGNVDDPESEKILANYLKVDDEKIRLLAVDSLLRIAQRQIGENRLDSANDVASLLLNSRLMPWQKMAAWKIRILAAGNESRSMIASVLKGKDELAQQAGISLIPQLVSSSDVSSLIGFFNQLSPKRRVQFASALSSFPSPEVRDFLMKVSVQSTSAQVRTEAILSLGKAGDQGVVEFLAKRAAQTKGSEKNASRESLVALRGKAVDEVILELISKETDQTVRNELLLAARERNIRAAREFFLAEASNPSADPSLVSRGLRAFGDVSLAENLLDITFKTEDENFQEELENILAFWAQNSARPEAGSAFFRNLLTRETRPEKQVILLRIIGKIGESSSLPLIRSFLDSSNLTLREAAVKSLSNWPEVEARDDLLYLARTSSDLKENVLAIRGLVRLTAAETYRRPRAVVNFLKELYSFCRRVEEKKLVLSVLPDFACREGLEFCESLKNDPEVRAEAFLAADKIQKRLGRK
jgi:HEAT repeat protein